MILVDTSVWIDHLRGRDTSLIALLETDRIASHPFVIGELACGTLRQRAEILALLHDLPRTRMASDDEALFFIERHRLMGLGLGYIDIHLLAGTSLTPETRLWTRDKRLAEAAQRLDLHFETGD